MRDLAFAHPAAIHLIWAAIPLLALLIAREARRPRALGPFVSDQMRVRLAARQGPLLRGLRIALIAVALGAGIAALMRPQSRDVTEVVTARRMAGDVMVVLDLSRSMLAEDAAPNRLRRAKAEIDDLLDQIRGNRVGLIGFAGRAAVLCPLTPDHAFFEMVLRNADTGSVARGGTRIGDALRLAVDAFGPTEGSRIILLITDGEDHDSFPLDAAREAAEAGVHIIAIGFGSEEGSPITITDPDTGARSTLRDRDGNVVQSRLDGDLLRKIALTTEGAYIPAGVAALDLESIVEAHVEPMIRAGSVRTPMAVPSDHYPWLVLATLVSLLGAVAVGALPGARREP